MSRKDSDSSESESTPLLRHIDPAAPRNTRPTLYGSRRRDTDVATLASQATFNEPTFVFFPSYTEESNVQKKDAATPTVQFAIIFIMRMAEPLAFTQIFPVSNFFLDHQAGMPV